MPRAVKEKIAKMKITKTQLKQIIAEELAEARGVEFPRLGMGYSDEDVELGEPPQEDPRGDLRAKLQGALDGMGREVTREDVLHAADRAAEVSRGADEAIYKALAVLFRSKKRMG